MSARRLSIERTMTLQSATSAGGASFGLASAEANAIGAEAEADADDTACVAAGGGETLSRDLSHPLDRAAIETPARTHNFRNGREETLT
jgi:hypothetical protein